MSSKSGDKLWGGRFAQPTDALMEHFSASVHFDKRLYWHDIRASCVHARMLARCGTLTSDEANTLCQELEAMGLEIESGQWQWTEALEDVHMNIEARLTERIGPLGKKLHSARSRNDQVATDIRLYLRDAIDSIIQSIDRLQSEWIKLAAREVDTILPGMTHLQIAQPVTFGHHMMAYFEMLERDRARLRDARRRMNFLPLGSAALAGTSLPIDREWVASELGFDGICANSMDAVSDRDFAIEFASASSLIMMHLSRCSEELILWSSAPFQWIRLPEGFCTGSSIMPQKRNPDVPELVRGKTGRVYGGLMSLLTLMKAQPLAYNRDNQEDKEPLFDIIDTLIICLELFARMVPGIEVNRQRCFQAACSGFSTATDVAEYLVRQNVPFREAHHIVGSAVQLCEQQQRTLESLSIEEWRVFYPDADGGIQKVLSVQASISQRGHPGGTAPDAVRKAIEQARLLKSSQASA